MTSTKKPPSPNMTTLPYRSVEEARGMIGGIKGAPVLNGARGKPPADVEELADALSRLSRFAAAQRGQFTSIEINPVLVRPRGGLRRWTCLFCRQLSHGRTSHDEPVLLPTYAHGWRSAPGCGVRV
jgi:hypothetical protein